MGAFFLGLVLILTGACGGGDEKQEDEKEEKDKKEDEKKDEEKK